MMELYINKKDVADRGFVEFLINKIIPSRLESIIDDRKLVAWDEYFFEEHKGEFNLGNLKNTRDIIRYGVQNFTYTTYGGDYIVEINNLSVIKGTSTKILPICKLINYGNTEVTGYGIFSKTIEKIKQELELYHNMYEVGMR